MLITLNNLYLKKIGFLIGFYKLIVLIQNKFRKNFLLATCLNLSPNKIKASANNFLKQARIKIFT
jgi:hypothetical protein